MSDPSSRERDGGDGRPEPGLDPGTADTDSRSNSVGLYLAGQRRLRGISVDDLAAETRIPRRNIERLEAGAFDAAPDGFSRGFVRTVAQALGLDADEAVMRLMAEPQVDEALLLRERRFGLLLRGALLSGLVLVGLAAGKLLLAWALPSGPDLEPQVVYRRDPVKLLAGNEQERAALAALVYRAEAAQGPTPDLAAADAKLPAATTEHPGAASAEIERAPASAARASWPD